MGLGERAIKGVLGLGAINALTYVGSLVVQLSMARLLSPEIFGAVALALAVRKISSIPANWGLGEAIMQETDHEAFLETLLWLRVGFATGFVAVAVGGGFLFRQIFDQTIVDVFIILVTVSWFNMVGGVFRRFRQRELGLSVLGVVDLLALVIAGGTALWFALDRQTVWVLVLYYVLRDLISSIGYVAVSPRYPSGRFNPAVMSWLVDFAKGMIVTKTMEDISDRGDDYLIGVLGSTAALGAYSVAWRLARGYTSIIQPAIRDGILPTFSRLEGNLKQSRRGIEFIARLQIHLSIPVYVTTFFAAPTAIPLLFGPEWRSATPIFRILSIAAILFPLHATAKHFYYSRGNSRVVLRSQVVSIGTMVIAMLALIPLLGGIGGALAVDAMLVVGVTFLFWQLRQDVGVKLDRTILSGLIGSLVAFGVGLGGTHFLPTNDGMVILLVYVPLGVVIGITYILVVIALGSSEVRDDLAVIRQAVLQ